MKFKGCKIFFLLGNGLCFVFLLLVLLKCFDMGNIAASINRSLFDVDDSNVSVYEEVKYTEMDFSNFKRIVDYNGNGISDNDEFVIGALKFVNQKPEYKSEYYDGGYPPVGVGVCTDVVASAFLEAGYDLRELVDSDIRLNQKSYNLSHIDRNIDYRRVNVLQVFFNRHAYILTNDLSNKEEWNSGDIVIFPHHIGVLSSKKNANGYPYVIHHGGQEIYEEDVLEGASIVAHYRWN